MQPTGSAYRKLDLLSDMDSDDQLLHSIPPSVPSQSAIAGTADWNITGNVGHSAWRLSAGVGTMVSGCDGGVKTWEEST